MKKVFASVLALVMVLSFAACGQQPQSGAFEYEGDIEDIVGAPETPFNMPNPAKIVESLEKLNELGGTNFMAPADGVTGEAFFSYEDGDYNMYEYKFEMDGIQWIERCAATFDDISGIYDGGNQVFGDNTDSPAYAETADAKCYRWFHVDGQYMIVAKDSGSLKKDDFLKIAEDLESRMSRSGETTGFEGLEGSYADEVSQRATLEAEISGSKLLITVSWSDSADSTTVWNMECGWDTDACIGYEHGTKTVSATGADDVVTENLKGYFELSEDGKLLWTGAPEDGCSGCVFAKIPE